MDQVLDKAVGRLIQIRFAPLKDVVDFGLNQPQINRENNKTHDPENNMQRVRTTQHRIEPLIDKVNRHGDNQKRQDPKNGFVNDRFDIERLVFDHGISHHGRENKTRDKPERVKRHRPQFGDKIKRRQKPDQKPHENNQDMRPFDRYHFAFVGDPQI